MLYGTGSTKSDVLQGVANVRGHKINSPLKVVLTIQEFINENKVVLDAVLCDGGEVRLQNADHLVEKLKHQSGIDILSSGCHNPDIVASRVEVAGPGYVGDGRSHRVTSVDHVHTKRIHSRTPVHICSRTRIVYVRVCVCVCVCVVEGDESGD